MPAHAGIQYTEFSSNTPVGGYWIARSGQDTKLGLAVKTQKSNASAMAASASAPIQMPMRLVRFPRACASASLSTV